ncbi:hypothetical protein ACQKGI_20355 [Peribacillus muralis]|uniref:hypothetical protein n=1 Tax=Peribacillus muralis TaxID=264697 RepID=UPI00381DD762
MASKVVKLASKAAELASKVVKLASKAAELASKAPKLASKVRDWRVKPVETLRKSLLILICNRAG